MKLSIRTFALLSIAGLALCVAANAQSVKPGTKATLKVSYEYVANGAKKDKDYPREWRVKRNVDITAQLAAQNPMNASAYKPMEAEQTADMNKKQAQAAAAAKKLEPTMEEAMKIVEKCGDDEACVEKAIIAFGTTHQLTEEEKSVKGDIAEISKIKDQTRYQIWAGVSQTGTYAVDEFYKGESTDPACYKEPRARCHFQEIRKGGGNIPSPPGKPNATIVAFETDSTRKDAHLVLPVPLAALAYDRSVKTNFPDEKDAETKGVLAGYLNKLKPITVAIPAGVKSLSGTETVKFDGAEGEGGTLTIKWQFATS
jgi:hypothetical protein